MSEAGAGPIRAAGCVLWRRAATAAGIELALIHRPRWDDWSWPKGKLKRGEDPLRGALREVAEETGMDCVPGPPLPSVHYLVDGRPKEVRYWAAEALDDTFVPNREVDRLIWLPARGPRPPHPAARPGTGGRPAGTAPGRGPATAGGRHGPRAGRRPGELREGAPRGRATPGPPPAPGPRTRHPASRAPEPPEPRVLISPHGLARCRYGT